MPFSTPLFLFAFLPLVLLAHTASPARLRNAVLLAASLLFYAWGEPRLVAVMLASVAANFAFGLGVATARGEGRRKAWVGVAVAFDLGVLGWFKYANFLRDELARLGVDATFADVALPIGISFYTFQAMSYVVDVYRGQAPVQRSPVDFALYIALFPQLIAGPIVRYRDVAEQLVRRSVTLDRFALGVRRFLVGLGKKLLVADTVAAVADAVFDDVPASELTAPVAWLGALCYTVQIYYDFSGYSDMAIGLGKMLGFDFLENFRHPYVARSITEFWRRWHISLSSWFRDYLYIPLGGNRRGPARTLLNLVAVFALCGLWHGASRSFLAWGLYHGAFLVVERMGLGRALERLAAPLRHAYALLVVIAGWVFFRAETLGGAVDVLRAMAGFGAGDGRVQTVGLYLLPPVALALALGALGSAPWLPWLQERARVRRSPVLALCGHAGLALVFALCAARLAAGTSSPFIYFRF